MRDDDGMLRGRGSPQEQADGEAKYKGPLGTRTRSGFEVQGRPSVSENSKRLVSFGYPDDAKDDVEDTDQPTEEEEDAFETRLDEQVEEIQSSWSRPGPKVVSSGDECRCGGAGMSSPRKYDVGKEAVGSLRCLMCGNKRGESTSKDPFPGPQLGRSPFRRRRRASRVPRLPCLNIEHLGADVRQDGQSGCAARRARRLERREALQARQRGPQPRAGDFAAFRGAVCTRCRPGRRQGRRVRRVQGPLAFLRRRGRLLPVRPFFLLLFVRQVLGRVRRHSRRPSRAQLPGRRLVLHRVERMDPDERGRPRSAVATAKDG